MLLEMFDTHKQNILRVLQRSIEETLSGPENGLQNKKLREFAHEAANMIAKIDTTCDILKKHVITPSPV